MIARTFPWKSIAWALALWGALVAAIAAIGYRTYSKYQSPGRFDSERQGFCDFHNGVYFPSKAFWQGISPYGQDYFNQFPVARPIPPFAPITMVVHWPLTWLALPAADVVYFALLLAQIAVLAWLAARSAAAPATWMAVLSAALLIVVSRGGYATLFNGYFTFLLVIGTVVCLYDGHRPWVAGPAMILACLKPTYAIPLTIVLMARRQWATALFGLLLVGASNGMAVAWLLRFHSPEQLWADVQLGQQLHLADPNEMPVNTWTRIDLMAILAKWTNWNPSEGVYLMAMVPLIAVPVWTLWRLSRSGPMANTAGLAGLIGALAIVVTLYKHYYDATILVPGLLALCVGRAPWVRDVRATTRWLLAGMLALVLLNYLSAQFVMERLLPPAGYPFVTSMNAVVLAAALIVACVEGFRQSDSRR